MVEFNTSRKKRGYALLANFSGGFAVGWRMAVRETFREALDIKQIPRRVNGNTEMLWTQGNLYDFQVGDTFYDSQLACTDWTRGLKELKLSVQIQSASTSGCITCEIVETVAKKIQVLVKKGKSSPKKKFLDRIQIKRQRLNHGLVRFLVYRPNADRSAVEMEEIIECTQDDFVAFLQTGLVRTKDNQLINLFAEPENRGLI